MSLIFKAGDDWTEDMIDRVWEESAKIGREEQLVTFYEPQIEIVTAKQMLDAYTSSGMPVFYRHWSYGKQFVQDERAYKAGQMGLAYEIVINSDPCIGYLMEENNMAMQALVIPHAFIGHSGFFKNNYLFKEMTDASAIVDYLTFAKNFILRCEERYGYDEVEHVLDACHALMSFGVNRSKRVKKLSVEDEERRALERLEQQERDYNPLWDKLIKKHESTVDEANPKVEPEENILYFIEKNAPSLPTWKREIIRIVRKIATYFEPQTQTKVGNEGFATFTHYYHYHRFYDKGLIDDGTMLEFYKSHNNVIYQHPYSRINPYNLGFNIFQDIKRVSEQPTDEDREWVPDICGKDWRETTYRAMADYRDETLIQQFLTPHVARKLNLFSFHDDGEAAEDYVVKEVARPESFRDLRYKLGLQHLRDRYVPNIQVVEVDAKGSRRLTLEHFMKNNRPLHHEDAGQVVSYIADLWEYTVYLKTKRRDADGNMSDIVISAPGKFSK